MEGPGWRSDGDLVVAVRQGERSAFGLLYERWFDHVFEAARRVVGDPDVASTVVVETFESLWYHLDQLHDPNAFGEWAVQTSRTFALDRGSEPDDQERVPPLPVFMSVAQMSAAISYLLTNRGVPVDHGMAGTPPLTPSGSPLGQAVGSGGEATNVDTFGLAGNPGGGAGSGILGGVATMAGPMASAARVSLDSVESFRAHRYEPPRSSLVGGMVDAVRSKRGAVLVILAAAAVACLVWFASMGDSDDGGAQVLGQLQTSSTPSTAGGAGGAGVGGTGAGGAGVGGTGAGDGAGLGAPDTTAPDPSTTGGEESVAGPRATPSTVTATSRAATTTSATGATTPTTGGTTTSSVATTTTSTTGATTSTTEATTSTTEATTSTTEATTSTTEATTSTTEATTSTTQATTSTTQAPEPGATLRVTSIATADCARQTVGYRAVWSTTNATRADLSVGGQTVSSNTRGSYSGCAPPGTAVVLLAGGPGGETAVRRVVPNADPVG